jgi:cell division protein FtsL
MNALKGKKKQRAVVAEFHTVKRIDNSRLVRAVQPARARELARTVALWCLVAGCFLLYGYQRFRCIELGFQLENLKSKQAQASAVNTELKLEVAGLRSPMRIDRIARRQLGLTDALPGQMEMGEAPSGAEVAVVSYPRTGRAR